MTLRTLPRVALLAFLLSWVGVAFAQGVPKPYVQARQLLLLQRWDQALQLIESVVPSSDEEWLLRETLLAEAYEGQQNYGALEILARQALERKPDRPDRVQWYLLRGRLFLLGDDVDSARAVLDRTWKEHPTDSVISAVATLYEDHTLSDLALATYLDARKVVGDSARFAMAIAELYEARRDYARATDEYFRAIHSDSSLTRQVENRVLALVNTTESSEAIEKELKKASIHPESAVIARRILTTLYLENGHPDLAWRTAWEVDSMLQLGGTNLIGFMRQSAERGYYDAASRAATTLLERYPTTPVRYQAEWELAGLAKTMGQWQSARDQYAQMARNSPVARFRIEAGLEYADLERENGGKPELADSVYAEVAASMPQGPYLGRALLGRSSVAVS
jgi:tetratricopeptide (TPR) repeat protein